MESREDLPRVSVGTVQDWQKLRYNYRDAALGALQAQIASKGLASEQEAILAHVEQFIERTFTLSQPNLRVNGHNFESLSENNREMEPFDETLDRRIWSLADTRLQWHKRIAETRRTIPAEIESTVSALLEHHRELDTTVLLSPSEEISEDLISEEDIDRQHRIEQALQKTSALANELDQTISQQRQRGERVKVIAMEINALKP